MSNATPDLLHKAANIARRRMQAATPGSQAQFRAAVALALIELHINKLFGEQQGSKPVRPIPVKEQLICDPSQVKV